VPVFLFCTVILARANVNAKETMQQNTGTDNELQIEL
jgi:hypothetical protein